MPADNPYATGAGGSDFERRVATSFVCSALVGVSLPPLTSPPTRISLQSAHRKYGFDDILLESAASDGSPQQRVFVSAKSTISPRASDTEFSGLISKAWKDWSDQSSFNRNKDAFLLVAATSRSPRIQFLGKLTDIARASADQLDFAHRLSLEGYHHATVRELRPEIAAIIEKETEGAPDGEGLYNFLQRFFVCTFDLDLEASQDKSRIIGLLKLASNLRDIAAAHSCWNGVFESLSLATAKAKVFDKKEFASLAAQHGLKVDNSSRTSNWLSNLRAHCRMTRAGIASLLFGNQRHVVRTGLLNDLGEALSSSQFILITGPPGTGKSALAVEAAESFAKAENVFCFQSEELAHSHLDAALQAAGLRDLNPEEWADALPFESRVLVIEALERLIQLCGSQEALSQLLKIVAEDKRWRIILTCRDYLADHVRDAWNLQSWTVMRVPLLEPEEFETAISDSEVPDLWLQQPAVRDVLKNLKWLDLTMRAAKRLNGAAPGSNWATLANWRDFVWRQLLNPDIDTSAQEVLIRIAVQRASSGSAWANVDSGSLEIAEQLRKEGILSKHDIFADRYRPEHDLLEDWALLFYVRREFADHAQHPTRLFAEFGDRLLLRRAFRHFLGELLEGERRMEGISFIRQVFTGTSCGKEWRQEVVNALLGSSCALDALFQTQDFWTDPSGDGLRILCHVLRIAYRRKPTADIEPECPVGPGWNALMTFVQKQGESFLRHHARLVTELLLYWRHAVTPECPSPLGLVPASAIVQGLWRIATEEGEPFERYWRDNERIHTSASANRLCWLVASVAGALDSEFFHHVGQEVFETERKDVHKAYTQRRRQSRDLVEFLISDHAGWVLARAHPRTMVRLCLQAYGLRSVRKNSRYGRLGRRNCGILERAFDFSPSSALHGPFLELLRHHHRLGEQFILKLVNESTRRWIDSPDEADIAGMLDESFKVVLNMEGKDVNQIADQGWWRCYRGWSPYPEIIECALMALETWLLEDVATRDIQNLEETLLRLMAMSDNVAITAVAASVATLYWSHCGRLAPVLLKCWPLIGLDRHRWMNDQSQARAGRSFLEKDTCYSRERQKSNKLSHREEHLEQFILKSQFGAARSKIWSVLDQFNEELKEIPLDQITDEIQTARLIVHRIDSRNLKASRSKDIPGQILLEPGAPPPELRQHLEETGKRMETNWRPMEMQMWAAEILDPMGIGPPHPERWREMLQKAQNFPELEIDPDRLMVFGHAPSMVAAVCLCNLIEELNERELQWCIARVTNTLSQQADLTIWQHGPVLTAWQAECGAARACGILSATRPSRVLEMNAVDEVTAIALSHPEKRVRFAAAEGLGRARSDSSIQLCACELLILHGRLCRNVDLRHRGPQRLPYEQIKTWEDRCSQMHSEVLAGTLRLREKFIKRESPNLRQIALFYPRGHEEQENLSSMLAALLNHESMTAGAIFSRVRDWFAIQLVDESDHGPGRKFARDSWRDYGAHFSQADAVSVGEVGRMIARRALKMAPKEVRAFYAPIFVPGKIAHLREKAGEFLKDLSIMLDAEDDSTAFWAAWEICAGAAATLGSQLNNEEFWHKLKVSPDVAFQSFGALVSAIFLNGMYMRADQDWPPLHGQFHRFKGAFQAFRWFALNEYIEFISTVGGELLPDEWPSISECVSHLNQRIGKSLLRSSSHAHLLRLLAKEVRSCRVPVEKTDTWRAILHLLQVLTDAGLSEAFRLRESVARKNAG